MAVLKCRGVIVYNDKLFVVKHGKHLDWYASPGGKLEIPESPIECIEREIAEEFGVKPEVGKLLYVYNFANSDGTNFYEFFFEIKNGVDYFDIEKLKIKKDEIFEILWAGKEENIKVLPEKLFEDFKNGILGSLDVQFIK